VNRNQILLVAGGVLALLAVFPPCRKADVVLNPRTNRVEEINPWRGYVPLFELPRPEGTRGGNFAVAWDVFAAHLGVVLGATLMAERLTRSKDSRSAFRYRLSTLLIVLTVAPMVLAAPWLYGGPVICAVGVYAACIALVLR